MSDKYRYPLVILAPTLRALWWKKIKPSRAKESTKGTEKSFLQWTHLLVNSDWNSSNWLFSAKLGGLEALPQTEKTLRAASTAGFSRLP